MKGVARKNIVDGRTLKSGPLGRKCPNIGLRLEKERVPLLDAKAAELGGISRSEVVRLALKNFGI